MSSWTSSNGNGNGGRFGATNKYGHGDVITFRVEPDLGILLRAQYDQHPEMYQSFSDTVRHIIDLGLSQLGTANAGLTSLHETYLERRHFTVERRRVEAEEETVEEIRSTLDALESAGDMQGLQAYVSRARALGSKLSTSRARTELDRAIRSFTR